MTNIIPWKPVTPRIPAAADPILTQLAHAAAAATFAAWQTHTRKELIEVVTTGADGTGTYRIDQLVESAILSTAESLPVNILSEESGFIDGGHAATVVMDPLDGSANAATGVPLSAFSAAIYIDGDIKEALTVWLENGYCQWANTTSASPLSTSGVFALADAAVDLLRPKPHPGGNSASTWLAIAQACSRVRILSSTCVESMLVANGSIDAFCDPGSETHRLVDLAAATLLLKHAGGLVIDAFDRPIEFDTDLSRRWSGIIAATPQLAEELRQNITNPR